LTDIWIITDGKKGTENQCIGLAESLDQEYKLIRIKPLFGINHLPSILWTLPLGKLPLFFLYGSKEILSFNLPKVIIASGKASVGISIILKKYKKDKIMVIQIQDPRVSSRYFDIVSSPLHDDTLGNNVIKTFGALNRINTRSISKAKIEFREDFSAFKKPIIALLIGGENKHFKMRQKEIKDLVAMLNKLQNDRDTTILTTFSRRTSPKIKNFLKSNLENYINITCSQKKDNAYFGYLAYADYFVVTEDSISMVSEVATTGKPVYVFQLKGKSKKFEKFYEQLYNRKAIRNFRGIIEEPWKYESLNDTYKVTKYLKDNFPNYFKDTK
tara:strand:- start:1634 stop:2617 length:984 start_codon:yes stop_codon:yes gene_type:complete